MQAWRTVVCPRLWWCSAEGGSSIHPSHIEDLKHTNKSLSFSLSVWVFVVDLVVVSTKVGSKGYGVVERDWQEVLKITLGIVTERQAFTNLTLKVYFHEGGKGLAKR